MQLSKKAISEFKRIWKNQFGTDISDEEANEKGLQLLQLMKVIYKPIPKKSKISES